MSASNLERRMTHGEVRVDRGEDRKIRGYAIVFDKLSLNLGGFREIIKPEAVDRTLNQAMDVRAFWNHDSNMVLGRTRSGTLQLRKDGHGLRIEIDPPSWADPQLETIERGDVSGMSFGFRTLDDEWDEGEDGIPLRYVTDMVISEVSPVSMPAYPDTDVGVAMRSLQEYQQGKQGRSIDFLRKLHKTRMAR